MDLWQLHIFVNVVELKSFSRAAEACHLSQPTVSTHIKELEEHFACRLVDRLGKNVLPTKGGELLYSFAKRMLALSDEAGNALAAFTGKPAGRLVIGGSTIPGGYILPGVIGAFGRAFPGVSVSLIIGDTQTVAAHVLEGRAELGVTGALTPDKRLVQEKLLDDEIRLIVPKGHAFCGMKSVTMDMLSREPFILREPGSGTRRSLEKILHEAGHGMDDLAVAAEMGSTEAVRGGIKAGVGISILSTRAVVEELRAGSMCAIAVEGLDFTRPFYCISHRLRTPSPVCAAFMRFLRSNASV